MESFWDLWETISLKKNGVSMDKYLHALNELNENHGLVAINRNVYIGTSKLGLMRFQRKLRFLKHYNIVRVVIDSGSPYREMFVVNPVEMWKITD